jgi:hypothetical protein
LKWSGHVEETVGHGGFFNTRIHGGIRACRAGGVAHDEGHARCPSAERASGRRAKDGGRAQGDQLWRWLERLLHGLIRPPLQLYFFTSGSAQQTFLLVINKRMPLPKLLKENVQKVLGGTELRDPIIAISTTDFTLDTIKDAAGPSARCQG